MLLIERVRTGYIHSAINYSIFSQLKREQRQRERERERERERDGREREREREREGGEDHPRWEYIHDLGSFVKGPSGKKL